MTEFICAACGTSFPSALVPPDSCPTCEEERQFVPAAGQDWTTMEELRQGHGNVFRQHEERLLSIRTVPSFAIGQRAFLVLSQHGNVLWDCVTLLDDATVTLIRALGGISAIAISHPHYYTAMNAWADAFDAPVYLHRADRQWVVNAGPRLEFWEGDTKVLQPGMTLVRSGGHFAGGTVLHWAGGAAGAGALLCGDVIQVAPDRRSVSFMRSYPNMIPLSAAVVKHVVGSVAPFRFEPVYGAFAERTIEKDGPAAIRRSAERYIRSVSGQGPADAEI